MQVLELASRRQAVVADGALRRSAIRRRHPQLVAEDLHGHRQVQGAELRIRRNVDELLATREVVVREARLLGADEHGDAVVGQALPDRRGGLARVDDRQHHGPQTRARPDDPAAVGDGLAKLACTVAARSTSSAPAARAVASSLGKCFGPHEHELARPIVFIARAVAPMLPGCEVSTSTMRTGMCTGVSVRGAQSCRGFAFGPALILRCAPNARHGQHRSSRGAPRRRDHGSSHEPARGAEGRREEPQRVRDAGRPGGRSRDHRGHPRSLPRALDSGRGERRERRPRVPVDHRPARRHDQLRARLPGVLGVDRCRARASSSTASSTTRCARRSSPRAAAKARSSTAAASASASARRCSNR